MASPQPRTALMFVANGSEDVETVGTLDVLRRAQVQVTVVAVEQAANASHVELSNGTKLVPDQRLEDTTALALTKFDAVVIPGGGPGTQTLKQNGTVLQVLRSYDQNKKTVAAICAGPTVLQAARLGLPSVQGGGAATTLAHRCLRLTSYPTARAQLESDYDYCEDTVVVDGHIITSRGPATALHFGVAIAKALVGDKVATKVAQDMLVV
ncbi:hypothetical protein H4R34_000536 [Dimargaris verticillata]|uniref:D-lactate dehydratase n=1 Tax=Dimargaris verticillata TaxID=2761393 RepID=A0A9W8B625_9FUNG|nr:hypothetical protein H4R34_000536 [Dimargaris verticillata]